MRERTLSIIKPDAVSKGVIGPIVALLEEGGLRVVGMRMVRLSRAEAEAFYAVHKERPFYGDLCTFMTSGPVVVMALEGEDAIAKNRKIMGATDSRKAEAGTIRNKFGTDVERNAVHGSDAPETAKNEVAFFFRTSELA